MRHLTRITRRQKLGNLVSAARRLRQNQEPVGSTVLWGTPNPRPCVAALSSVLQAWGAGMGDTWGRARAVSVMPVAGVWFLFVYSFN